MEDGTRKQFKERVLRIDTGLMKMKTLTLAVSATKKLLKKEGLNISEI